VTRRARIVLASAGVLFALFAVAVAALVGIGTTQLGRDWLRDLAVTTLRGRVHGKLYVGRVSGGFLSGLTVDSLAIRDREDSLFLSTGRVTVHYDLRDLLDRRILLRDIRAEHPVVHIRQHQNGDWNFRQIFPSTTPSPLTPRTTPAFVELDSAVLHDASIVLTLPWSPDPRLRRVQRDSAIRFELSRRDHEIRRTRGGFARTWRWTGADLVLRHGRISNPDSVGMKFVIAAARVNESDPPFAFRNASGVVRQLGDSVWVAVPHFDLPASTGSLGGKIVWGGDLPIRYDIHVRGDSVSLADVAWVYPTLPRTGSGQTLLEIRTERDPRITDYILSDMDVRSTRSHLQGGMTFVLGHDTLGVTNVRLAAEPVNFDLLRTLNGKPLPYNWQGNITGTVRASGGNLARFHVEDARFTFADANVPGAITRGTAHGELNIYEPAFTAFNEFTVNAETLDLRTLQYLNPNFPRLQGTVAGSAVLDSSWLDLRFHDAQLTHQDGTGPQSHVTGSGRITWGAKYLTYDLALNAEPLAFATIRKSYQGMPLRASLSGPIRVVGQSPDLAVTASLSSGTDTLTWDGHVDADAPTYGARGTGTFAHADVRDLLQMPTLPRTALTGRYALDVTGDSVADFTGTAALSLDPSSMGRIPLAPSLARVRFESGVVRVDTLAIRSGDATLAADGSLSLVGTRTGALHYRVSLPSLALAERLRDVAADSGVVLSGRVTATGTLTGTPSALATSGTLSASDLAFGAARAGTATGHFALRDLTGAPAGSITLSADSGQVGPFPVPHASVALQLDGGNRVAFQAGIAGRGDVGGRAAGVVTRDSALTLVRLDSLTLAADTLGTYALTAPARLVVTPGVVTLDSLVVQRDAGAAAVAVRNVRVAGDSIQGALRTRGFSLGLLELFGNTVTGLNGALTANVDVGGTFSRPRFSGAITMRNGTATVTPVGLRLAQIDADIALDGDTVRIRRLGAVTNAVRRGTLDVRGTIAFDDYDNPAFALEATAHNFRAIDRRGLASLDISTATPITLTGPYSGAVVTGGLTVVRGAVYIPEVIRKRVVDLSNPDLYDVVDTTVAANRAILPASPSTFVKNLRLQNVGVSIGDDVWLRSNEANIKLGGSLNVTLGRQSGTDRSQLALEGELRAERGTYRLNVVPFVQPTFDVEQGTLRFYGTADLNPTLDITAINTVRKPLQSLTGQDVRIRATIGGTLAAPTLTLSSADNLPLSQSDLLSYLITGQPSFALDSRTQEYVNQLASVAVRSAGNLISSAIPRSVFDVVELQTPTALTQGDAAAGPFGPTFYNNLLTTRAVVGKQLNNRLFLNFSTGFCTENFRNNLGVRLEYRIGRTYSAQLGVEPGSSDLACARPGAAQAIQETPRQFGIDFLRSWRF